MSAVGIDRTGFVVPAAVAFAADAISKLVAVRYLDDRDLELGAVALRLSYNSGIAFGLGAGAPLALVLGGTVAVTSVVAVAGWRGLFGNPVGAGLIVGGAVANVADRSFGGSVVDMIDVGWWPTFNLADVFINVGIVLTVLVGLRTTSLDEAAAD